jgi:hypothetical protein
MADLYLRFAATPDCLLIATATPSAIHSVHYSVFTHDLASLEEDELSELEHVVYVSELLWIVDPSSA